MGLSEELFDRAVKVIPGGVNSPVRAYGAIVLHRDLSTAQTDAIFMMLMEKNMWIISIPGTYDSGP